MVMVSATPVLKTRYPGSKPFTRDDEYLFFGRDEEIARLTTFIKVEKTTILYGKSGLGKTSLLNAGVLPRLEKEHQYTVIPVRLNSYTQGKRTHPLDIAEEAVAALRQQKTFLDEIEPQDISLWQHIKAMQWPHSRKASAAPPEPPTFLLVFDQFEELFTYPAGINELAEALADLLYNRIPKSFQRALRLATRTQPDLLTPEQAEFLDSPVNLKILMSIRSDRMSLLDSLSTQIPSILLNCYELKPLSREQAEEGIVRPAAKEGDFLSSAFSYEPGAVAKILDYLTRSDSKPVESFQLQILCQYVEENIVIAAQNTCVGEESLGNLELIYQNYYSDSLKKLGTEEEQLKAQKLIEEGLIFEKEQRRISMYEGQILSTYDIDQDLLRRLANTHIIRSEPHSSGGYTYEVSHDTLVAPILKAKALRYKKDQERILEQKALEKKARRKRKFKRAAVFIIVIVSLVLGIYTLLYGVDSSYFGLGSTFGQWFISAFLFGMLLSWVVPNLALIYEFIVGESILSKLRKISENPAKQNGFLGRIGRWLS
jgi:hypothetical protein